MSPDGEGRVAGTEVTNPFHRQSSVATADHVTGREIHEPNSSAGVVQDGGDAGSERFTVRLPVATTVASRLIGIDAVSITTVAVVGW